jgi:glycosyltransferase involved in cell wall biosynthesis
MNFDFLLELEHFLNWSKPEQYLVGFFCLLCIYINVQYAFLYRKGIFNFPNKKINANILPPISVVIAAKNEKKNLTEFLPKVLNQNYPEFEVFVVDDCSWDGTYDVLLDFKEKYEHLNISKTVEEEYEGNFSGKKLALTIGVKGAKYENMVFIDADCYPNTENWLTKIGEKYAQSKMLLLYGAYKKGKGLLNACLRFETYLIALNYSSFASKKRAFMGVGRNLAYKKEVFYSVKGFASHWQIPSGDDDLFVQDYVKTKKPSIGTLLSDEAKTISNPVESWKEWFFQKRRHFSASKNYSLFTLTALAIKEILPLIFFILPILFLFSEKLLNPVFIGLYGIALLVYYIKNYLLLKHLGERLFVLLIPIYTVLVFLFRLIVGVSNWMQKPTNWQGR